MGVIATRYSWFLTSFGTPIRNVVLLSSPPLPAGVATSSGRPRHSMPVRSRRPSVRPASPIARSTLRQVSRGQVLVGPAALGQRRQQPGVAGDVLEPVGQPVGAVVVAAEADVLDARRPRGRARRGPRRRRCVGRAAPVLTPSSPASRSQSPATAWFTNLGTKVTMQTPPLPASRASTSSGTLRGWSHTRPRRGVREHDRHGGDVERLAHHVGAHVAEVDEHADPVHLGDDLTAEVGEPAEHRLVGGRVGPRARCRCGSGSGSARRAGAASAACRATR